MKFEVETLDETIVFTLKSERLDNTISAELKSQLVMIANSDNEHLIINLTDVQMADSSGISALLLGHRLYRDSNRQFTLCGIHQNIRKLLEITQLDKVFTIAETKEKALADVLSDEDEG